MTFLSSRTHYPKWQCQIGGDVSARDECFLVISQSKRILLPRLINELEKATLSEGDGSICFFGLFSISISLFSKQTTGKLGNRL